MLTATQDIGHSLHEAGGLEARSLPTEAQKRWNFETKNNTWMGLSIIATAAFTTVCNLPSPFSTIPEKLEYQAKDVITAQLPPVFYLMVLNSAVFVTCLAAILVLLWTLPHRPVVVLLNVTFGVVYAILVKNIMPKMLVRVGNGSIGGACLVGLLALGFICIGAILCYCFSRGYKIIKRVISFCKLCTSAGRSWLECRRNKAKEAPKSDDVESRLLEDKEPHLQVELTVFDENSTARTPSS